ncbi:ATP-binding cassette domain-containing protein [Marinifilum caeruleilacunae]|uniref:ATP-binding cassette domain-containing protein n=1 Tax=Marinifilum caeruleilacunae TaxID=2499076 RepID=A0ABX1WW01_9BACT|nr:ATP-binding cassette domain-containing protein [Marinifilum caeruleilacunae]NOU60300.1 ATP-binding cassette domain-containing protein [Marinifilum caeruleilacunae]
MSERILKALMQLFAIIAHPKSSATERRRMVSKYLKQHLDQETAEEYLVLYDQHYEENQRRTTKKSKIKKYTSASSVRVLRICTEINEELIIRQKVIVLIQLLEFLNSEDEISEQEFAFVETVADTFNLPKEGYERLRNFVLNDFDQIQRSSRLLTISNSESNYEIGEHYYSPGLIGKIKILRLQTVDMFVMRFKGIDELFMNGQSLSPERVHVLSQGSSIRNPKIDPIYFSDIVGTFYRDDKQKRVVFEAKNIEYRFKEDNIGVHDLSFKEESGKMVGIIGSSGAGKTTLLNVLNGSAQPSLGNVVINGYDITADKSQLEGVIGHVSQDDLLIESLTVFENLYYNAKLCFDKYSSFQLIRLVLKLLKDLGLYEARNLKVGNPLDKKISGGQRKRLNIALELIREPSVLFLDEPTSGLSSRDSAKIMDLLKNLALKGKLIFVVIHQPASDIFKMFDRLLILDTGGYLIFNGNPLDAITYFKSQTLRANRTESECNTCGNVDADQIFNIVESEVLDEYGNPTQVRKVSPIQWYQRFKDYKRNGKGIDDTDELPPVSFKIPSAFKQFWVFTKRDVISKFANRQYLFINLFETPLLALILSYIIKYYNIDAGNELGYTFSNNSNMPVYLFMAVIVALFIGLTLSAEEIIKDRKILKRERFLNLSKSGYLISKIVILFTISAFQAFLFTLIGNSILEIKGMFFEYWLALFSAWCFANMLGLIISDSFKTVITIYILIPFILIPQLILSGIIVKFDKLNPNISAPNSIPWYGEIITARWAYEALAVKQFKDNKYNANFYVYEKLMSKADYRKNYWLPILKNKLNECERYLNKPEKLEKLESNLILLQNELSLGDLDRLAFHFERMDHLSPVKLDDITIKELRTYFDKLNRYYINLYNVSNRKKDEHLVEVQKQYENKQEFVKMKKEYSNERLTEFVRNSNDIERIIEYQNRLYQKIDPIYRDPECKLLKAHFYAPQKCLLGKYYDTYWVNIIVIWCTSISLYIVLYFGLLKKALGIFEQRMKKKKYSK